MKRKLTCFQGKYEKSAMRSLFTNFSNTLAFYKFQICSSTCEEIGFAYLKVAVMVPKGTSMTVSQQAIQRSLTYSLMHLTFSGDSLFESRLSHFYPDWGLLCFVSVQSQIELWRIPTIYKGRTESHEQQFFVK